MRTKTGVLLVSKKCQNTPPQSPNLAPISVINGGENNTLKASAT